MAVVISAMLWFMCAKAIAVPDTPDTANIIVRSLIAWAVAVVAGIVLNWLLPLPFVPATAPAGWPGAIVGPLVHLSRWSRGAPRSLQLLERRERFLDSRSNKPGGHFN